ncbi:Outer membrane lipoprotein carrier protein LolA [Labilithrix luteola]|uniref:Outer membrane lipoprotein carrier protein LolA n=1 Tax=Labilithrix luteola TaxID=1391654 RepID=A0A0K1QEA0_9BACT|nr:outer membrane lipoprotein carrier protein LolA [Labilithrix luteola]AKV03740.1 Outer membrane lipoprotein carrier protein LolA [Labilithrix luteola]
MRRIAALAFAALVAVAVPLVSTDSAAQAGAQALPAAKANEVATKVQAFYDRTTSFASDFTQEFFVKSHNVKKTSKGTVTFAKPGKMYWDYSNPAGNRVVSDGTILKVYEAANKQMFEQTVNKSQYPAALSFLVGGGKLTEVFNFELYDGAAMGFPGGQVLVGTPKQPTPAYQKVLFYVDSQTAQVRRVLIVDGQGNRNRFDFENPRVNVPVNDDMFKFTPPAGTQLIKP